MTLSTKRWLRGMLRSWTAHTGVYLAVLGYLQTQDKLLTQWFGADAMGQIMMLFGLLVVVLRAKTNQSVEDKGR